MKKVNLGCGDRYTQGWVNLDFNSENPDVIPHNLLNSLPFSNEEVDVIYNSHFLEHFSLEDAKKILTECYRVLKKGGVIRIVVPDLESVCREYLYMLDNIDKPENEEKYQWIVMELLDQMVRTEKWGLMNVYWEEIVKKDNKLIIDYVKDRLGIDIRQYYDDNPMSEQSNSLNLTKIKKQLLNWYIGVIKNLFPPAYRKAIVDQTMLGEKHKWMYDKYSLPSLLQTVGFSKIEILNEKTSKIPNFNDDYLDINIDGTAYRKSSIYCEAYK
ncbi:MAG: methyltransferase domain-containing protein [Crocosphaera sp.]|nr:methyltransferase domain-containing protein [Crocosphaera sp.]